LIREYVHDVGLCTLNMAMLEDALRHHLAHRTLLRGVWPMKVQTYNGKVRKFAEATLSGLATRYENAGGDPEFAATLRAIADDRNVLVHDHLPLTNYSTMRMSLERVQAVRSIVLDLARRANKATHMVQLDDCQVFGELIKRIDQEGIPRTSGAVPLEMMLAGFENTLRKIEAA